MKNMIFTAVLVFTCLLLSAQAREGKIEYNKENQACLVMEYNFPPEAVENGFIHKMDKLGYKGKEEKGMFNKDKGFRVYKDARIGEISSTKMDYIINVEQKSKKEEDETIMYFLINRNGDNALPKLNTDELGKAKAFLYNLLPDIEAANLELKISDQEEILSKAEKKMKTLQDDKEDMEKKIQKLQDDLKENEKDQEKQKEEVENQKKILENLKDKRKN
jgi:hypothetical protein